MENIIEFKKVSFSYDKEKVLEDINFQVNENDFIGIIGPNGGGKTTILKLILGLLKPDQGNILIKKKVVDKARPVIGYLPQYSKLDDKFPITVTQVIAMGTFRLNNLFPIISTTKKNRIREVLRELNIENLADRLYGNLSGGQKQRCLIARAIISNPEILILDEPTASVDPKSESDIYELLLNLNRKMTIILVSHDLGFVSSYIKRAFFVNKTLCSHKLDEVTYDHLTSDIYTNKVRMINHDCSNREERLSNG